MKTYHPSLVAGRWKRLSFVSKMANIGSEVIRSLNWKERNKEISSVAMRRALELIDATLETESSWTRLKETARVRELLCDFYYGDNAYCSTEKLWEKYFLGFNYFARLYTPQNAHSQKP